MPVNINPLEMMDELIDLLLAVKEGRRPIADVLACAWAVRNKWATDGIDFDAIREIDIMTPAPAGLDESGKILYVQLSMLAKAYAAALDLYFGPGMSEKSVVLAESAAALKAIAEGRS